MRRLKSKKALSIELKKQLALIQALENYYFHTVPRAALIKMDLGSIIAWRRSQGNH